MEPSALSLELKIRLKKAARVPRVVALFHFISTYHLRIEIIVATRIPKPIIKDKAS